LFSVPCGLGGKKEVKDRERKMIVKENPKIWLVMLLIVLRMSGITIAVERHVPSQYPTIQAAIDAVVDGDEVVVAPGTYTGAGNYDIKFYGKAITVRSIEPGNPSVAATTVIDCQRKGRGFIFINGEGPNSILSGLTITYGRGEKEIYGYGEGGQFPTRGGGAIFCYNSSPRIQNCVITRNIGGFQGRGGAIYSWGGSPLITNCTISENFTEWGGGGIWCRNSNIEIRNCDIRENLEIDDWFGGGGIQCWEGHPTITHCSIINNTSMGVHQNGGGIYCRSPGALIEHCIITANTALDGGGIYFYRSSPPLFNCKITSNNAERSGGGIFCLYSSPAIARCTFSDNLATSGGGAYFFGSTLSISDCIFWTDTARSGSEMSLSTYSGGPPSQISVVYTNVQGGPTAVQVYPNCTLYWGEGSVDIDPRFVLPGYWADANNVNIVVEPNDPNAVWADGDYHLLPDSPCINAGDPNYVPEPNETDIDGEARVMFVRVDMGSDEFNPIHLGIVSKKRVARTEFAYDCNATFTNLWPFAVTNVELQMMQVPENMTIIEPNVTFGDIEFKTRQSITSIDTCMFQVDRSVAIDPDKIVWKVKCQRADTGQQIELTINGVDSSGLEGEGKIDLAELVDKWLWTGNAGSIKEDITGDGIVNLADLAALAATPR
jgi:hypothetical protein